MTDPYKDWEPVIGLEIHVELNTESKLFSPAPNHFGDEPNTNISEVCTGQPGALPVLNREAVRKAVLFGCAIGAQIAHYSRFDRKSYFYPDSPRNFQITQFEMPLLIGGTVTTEVEGAAKTFTIEKTHLEDDAGMLKHFTHFAGVDYNRAGVPLIEIVSTPCLFSIADAVAYAMAIKAILEYLQISDCNMEEGSLRMDANVSVRPRGSKELRPKSEIKNLNSFTYMGLALQAESKRQIQAYLSSSHSAQAVGQATYRWDPEKKETVLMRRKERAEDYRYFIEPDLPPLILEEEYIDAIRRSVPELPYQRWQRYISQLGLPKDAALILVNEKPLADYFEAALEAKEQGKELCARTLCNWIIVEFAGRYKDKGLSAVWQSGIPAPHLAELVGLIKEGVITGKIAKSVADEMVACPHKSPKEILKEHPSWQPLNDRAALGAIIDTVLAEQSQTVNDFLNGKEKAFAFLVGQVMKATGGTAPPPLVHELLKEKLKR